ncbi:MAG: hypothetical protein ACRD1O_05740 [Terriglobia bacterium]
MAATKPNVILSRFAPIRIALSEAKRLTINSAKDLLLLNDPLEKQILRFALSKVTPIFITMGEPKAHETLRMTCSENLAKKARIYDLAMQGVNG